MNKPLSSFDQFRNKIYKIIYKSDTVSGRLFDLILLGVILFSVILIMLETVQGFNQKYHEQLIVFEWIVTVLFTIEYLLRIICINKPFRYIFNFYGIIDLLAILPMYLSRIFPGTNVFVIVRALRLLRLFKILHIPQINSQYLQLINALKASKGKIIVFIYFVLVCTIIIGSLMYLIEGKEGGFTSIPVSIYWTIVTLTTVGYGDISPITPLGQFVASLVMILGYGIIAVPTGIVTAEFAKNTLKNSVHTHKNPCPNCGLIEHPDDSKFCYQCGATLSPK
ncbi:ion transporter [Flavobacterium agrisoli]|uniref:Ion transporter n=1 Tax=Flavobacterium agrisoli TaxID=2793066 RepID=A0A934PKI1_9FLAO|nr:ion transporter [Flavobacterium agrisoli]MBK0368603.1 ion transporter [Flavobacterium agrisoli]